MASRIGEIQIFLKANTAAFIKELDKSRTASTAFGVAVGSIMADVAKNVGRFAADAALSLPRLVKSQIDLADQLQATSEKTSASVETLSVLQHQAELSNVSFESLTSGIGKFARTVADAVQKPSSDAGKAMQKLGVDLEGVKAGTVSVDEAFLQAADGIKGIKNAFELADVGQAAFGKGFKEIAPVLKQGREGFAATRKELELLGGLLTAETAQQADQFKDNLDKIQKAVNGVGLSIAAELLPELGKLSQEVLDFAKNSEAVDKVGDSFKFLFREIVSGGVVAVGAMKQLLLGTAGLVQAAQEFSKAIALAPIRPDLAIKAFSDAKETLKIAGEEMSENFALSVENIQKIWEDLPAKLNARKPKAKAPGIETPDTDKAEKALADLVAKFDASLKPADALNKELVQIGTSGRSTADILAVYGDEIIKAVEAQKAHGQALDPYIAQLFAIAKAQEEAKESLSLWVGTMDTSAAGIGLLLESMVDLKEVPAQVADALDQLGDTNKRVIGGFTANLEKVRSDFALLGLDTQQELSQIAVATEQAYDRSGLAAEAGSKRELTARIAMLEAQKEAITAAGGEWVEIQQKALEQAQKALDKFSKQDALKDEFKQIGVAVSSGLEAAMQKWEGFGKLVVGILDDIAATILRNQVTAPLSGWLSTALGSLGSVIGGGIGGGASSAPLPLVGAFAKGGPVKANIPVIVGEEDKEIFLPYTAKLKNFVQGMDGAQAKPFPNLSASMEIPKEQAAKFSKRVAGLFDAPTHDGTTRRNSLYSTNDIFSSNSRSTNSVNESNASYESSASFSKKLSKTLDISSEQFSEFKRSANLLTVPTDKPSFIGKNGPQLFKPPVDGTIIPLDTPEGKLLQKNFQRLNMARENGGPVSAGKSYLTGERGMEAFIPTARESGGSDGNVTYISMDLRGAEAGVEQKVMTVLRQAVPGIVQLSLSQMLDRQSRTT
jgi:hypothetical protein